MKLALCILAGAMGATALPAPSNPLPAAPAEVTAAAPHQTVLLAYRASGSQEGDTAVAVYETSPDADDVRHRVLTIFGNRNGTFVPEVTSDKLIACSKCTQFHNDAFAPENVKVSPGHIHLAQFDSGEMPSTTSFDFEKRQGEWYVTRATRVTYEGGDGDPIEENLPIPASGLVQHMNGQWSVPTYWNAIVVNDATGRFSFEHGEPTLQSLRNSIEKSCKGPRCRVLAQQQDGCISLVHDSDGKSFGGGSSNPKSAAAAIGKALEACKAAGSEGCREIRTDCSKGIL